MLTCRPSLQDFPPRSESLLRPRFHAKERTVALPPYAMSVLTYWVFFFNLCDEAIEQLVEKCTCGTNKRIQAHDVCTRDIKAPKAPVICRRGLQQRSDERAIQVSYVINY